MNYAKDKRLILHYNLFGLQIIYLIDLSIKNMHNERINYVFQMYVHIL